VTLTNAPPPVRLREIARAIGLSPHPRREVQAGELRAFKIGRLNGGDWFVARSDPESYVRRMLVPYTRS
jgi:hypothetical protein